MRKTQFKDIFQIYRFDLLKRKDFIYSVFATPTALKVNYVYTFNLTKNLYSTILCNQFFNFMFVFELLSSSKYNDCYKIYG